MARLNTILNEYFSKLASSVKNFETRHSQLAISELVFQSFRQNQVSVIEAGTGSGKSLAALIPAIAEIPKKTVISTYTINLQEQYINKDLPMLREALDNSFTYSLLKGRNNYLSLRRFLDFDKDNQIDYRIKDWLFETKNGDKSELYFAPDFNIWKEINSDSNDCLGFKCPKFSECFYFKARKLSEESDIIVVNHNLLLLDAFTNGAILPKYDNLVIDEAHHITSSAYDIFTMSFSFLGLKQVLGKISKQLNLNVELLRNVELASTQYFSALNNFDAKSKTRIKTTPTDTENLLDLITKLFQLVKNFDLSHLNLAELELNKFELKIKSYLAQIEQYLNVLELLIAMPNDYVFYVEYGANFNPKIIATPLDVSESIYQNLLSKESKAIIFMSATLDTGEQDEFGYFIKNSGISNLKYNTLKVDSEFNYQEQAKLYIPNSIADPNDYKFIDSACYEIKRLLDLSQGNAFVLFTSYQNLNRAYDILSPQITYPCKKQNEMPPNKLIEWFCNNDNSVLFATSSFWEGVSIDGSKLKLVIIDKIPFKSPGDPHYDALCEAISNNLNSSWFNELALPHAIIRLKQGVGRLIRTKSDTGIVAILDSRIRQKTYGKRIVKALPDMKLVYNFESL